MSRVKGVFSRGSCNSLLSTFVLSSAIVTLLLKPSIEFFYFYPGLREEKDKEGNKSRQKKIKKENNREDKDWHFSYIAMWQNDIVINSSTD